MNHITKPRLTRRFASRNSNAHKGTLATSAASYAADALACFNVGDYAHAFARARESLRYAIEVFHSDYAKVAA